MKTLKLNKEKVENLVKSFDKYANRIDNGSQYRKALNNNNKIVQILASLGLDLELKEITPVVVKEYEVMGYTVKTLDDAKEKLNSHIQYLTKRLEKPTDPFDQTQMDEILNRINKIVEISFVAVEDNYSYSLEKVQRELSKDEL